MIPVSEDLKNAVLNEEKPKTLTIYPNERDIEALNWFYEPYNIHLGYAGTFSNRVIGITDDVRLDLINLDYVSESERVVVSTYFKSDLTGEYMLRVDYTKNDGTTSYNAGVFNVTANTETRLYVSLPNTARQIDTIEVWYDDSVPFTITCSVYDIQIDLRKEDIRTPLAYNNSVYATPANLEKYMPSKVFAEITNDKIISESFSFEESICSAEQLKFGGAESSSIEISLLEANEDYVDCPINFSLDINGKGQFDWKNYKVKKVEKSSRGGLIVKNLKAYDKLDNLSQNAYAWYSQYMWGMSGDRSTPYANYRFDFERQIFATYFNLARSFGVDGEEYIEKTEYDTYIPSSNQSTDFYVDYYTSGYNRLKYSKRTVTLIGSYKAYTVEYSVENEIPNYREHYDSLMRGASDIGSICVDFFDGNGNKILGGFLYDCGDIILPPPEAETMVVYCPWVCSKSPYQTADNAYPINSIITVYGVNFTEYDPYDIVNSHMPLVYYSYVYRKPTHEDIFKANSSIKARDVMRSLVEMCGCFYRHTRDGKPQFFYPSEHGLYPENILFPANDLFPKKSGEITMPTGYYFTADFAEYQVQKFGGVQVVVNTKDNTGAVCRAEYWYDEENDNAYLIDDNIFLCSEQFKYEYDTTDTIAMLLENLYGCLDNLQYTPFNADTIGTPFLESGDRFTLLTKTDGFESFIFERKLKGIQALRDYYEARGIQKTPRVKNFEWEVSQ